MAARLAGHETKIVFEFPIRINNRSFWSLNGGLALMTLVSLAPSGFYQFYYAVRDGLWYARSPEIASGEVIRALAWARVGPDLIFIFGALMMFAFVIRGVWLTFVKRV